MITTESQKNKAIHFSEEPANPEKQLSEKQKESTARTSFGRSSSACKPESLFITLEPVTRNTHYVEQHFSSISSATATNATDNIRTTVITSKPNSYLKTAMQMTTAKLSGIHAGDIDRESNRVVVDIDTTVIPEEITLFDFLDDYREDAKKMDETDRKTRVSIANVMEREVACRNWSLAHVSDALRCMYPAYRLRKSEESGQVKPSSWFCEYHDVDKWDLNETFTLLSLLSRAKVKIEEDKPDEPKLEIDKLEKLSKVMNCYFKMQYTRHNNAKRKARKEVEQLWRDLFPSTFDENNIEIRKGLKNFLLEINSFDKYRLWKLKSHHLLVQTASLIKDEDMKKVLSGRLPNKSEVISQTGLSVSENSDYIAVHSKSDSINKIEGRIIKGFLERHRAAALVTIGCNLSHYSGSRLFDVHDEPMQVYKMLIKPVSKEEYLKRYEASYIKKGDMSEVIYSRVKKGQVKSVESGYKTFIESIDKSTQQMKFGFIFTTEDIRKTHASKFMTFYLKQPICHQIDNSGTILYDPATLLSRYIEDSSSIVLGRLSGGVTEAEVKKMTHLITGSYLKHPFPPDSEGSWKTLASEGVFKDFIEGRMKFLKESNIPKNKHKKFLDDECSALLTLIHLHFKSLFVSVMSNPGFKFERHIISAVLNYTRNASTGVQPRSSMEMEDIRPPVSYP